MVASWWKLRINYMLTPGTALCRHFGATHNPNPICMQDAGGDASEYRRLRASDWDFSVPSDWRDHGRAAYVALAKSIADKQEAWAMRGGLPAAHASAAREAAEKNRAVDDLETPVADIDDIALGYVGEFHGARAYRQVQPDPYRDHGAWEWLVEEANRLQETARWLESMEAVAQSGEIAVGSN